MLLLMNYLPWTLAPIILTYTIALAGLYIYASGSSIVAGGCSSARSGLVVLQPDRWLR